MTFLNNLFITCDAPRPWELYFQNNAGPQTEALVELHDNIMFYLVITLFGVAWIMLSIIRNYVYNKSPTGKKYLNHGTLIELIWTITPTLILILIAFPSFKLLYLMDEVTDPSLTVFVEGHQWYWSYQCPDFINDDNEKLEFHSYLVYEPNFNVLFSSSSGSGSESSSSSSSGDIPPVDQGDDDDQPNLHSDIALCEHINRYVYPISGDGNEEQEVVSNAMCDLSGDRVGQSTFITSHSAFPSDYVGYDDTRRPFYCPDCFAVMCHECSSEAEDLAPEAVEEENSDNN